MNQKSVQNFDTMPVFRLILSNMIPAVVSMLMSMFYNLADTFFIGQTQNAYMVAAVSLATPAFAVFMSFGLIFGVGGTSYISRLLGMGKTETVKKVSSFAFWTGTAIGTIGMLVMWIFAGQIAMLLGASDATLTFVTQYLSTVAIGIPFLVISASFSNILRAEGKASKAMNGMIIGNLANIILDPIFILALGMGVQGAAIATVIGNVLAVLYYLYELSPKRTILSIKLSDYSAGEGILKNVLSVGIPASLNSFMMTISIIVTNHYMLNFGDMAVAAMGVAMKVAMMMAFVLIGVATGVQPIFGYFYGARNRTKFLQTLKYTLIIAVCVSILMTIVVYVGSEFLVRSFLTDDTAIEYGVSFTNILVYSGPVLGILFVFNNAIQGMGMGLQALIISISRQGLIYIPLLSLSYRIFHDPAMLTAAQPVADYTAAALAFLLFLYVFRKYMGKESLPVEESKLAGRKAKGNEL